jgi:heme-degrading monooxygenase HmoA
VSESRIQVLLFVAAPDDPDAVREAYEAISRQLSGTPGLLRNTLLERTDEPGRFVVVSEWQCLKAFLEWERSPGHRPVTTPLRPYHDRTAGFSFGVYQVASEYLG